MMVFEKLSRLKNFYFLFFSTHYSVCFETVDGNMLKYDILKKYALK